MYNKIGLLILAILYLALSISSANDGGDFDVFIDAAQKISEGQNIYQGPFVKGLQYFYSPLFAVLLIPFSNYSFITELLWLLFSGFWLYRSWVLISSFFNKSVLDSKEFKFWVFLSFFFIIRFLLYNLAMIQVTIFLMWAILEALVLIRKDKLVLGSLLIAVIINIKIMPIVVVPYLLYRGCFKSSAYVIVFSVLLLFLPGLFIGFDFNMFLLSEWWTIINPSNSEHVLEAEITYQSIVGTIPVFITETTSIINQQRNFLNLEIENAILITNLFRLFFAGITVWFLGAPFKRENSQLSEIRAISYLLLVIPLIFPHQQKYAFIMIFPSMVYLSYYFIIRVKQESSISTYVLIGGLLLVSLVFTPFIGSDIIGRHNYDVIQHFRILGISSMLLVPFLIIATPKKLELMISSAKIQESDVK